MVKTRHSVEVEDSPAQFVSLTRINTRRAQNYGSVAQFSSGDSDEEFVQEKTGRGSPKRASARRRVRCIEDDSAEEESPELQMGPISGRGRSSMNGETYGVIRRSSRKRKPLYDTLNQSLIIDNAALGLVDIKEPMPRPASSTTETRSLRKHDTRQKDKKSKEDGFSDMYSRVKRGRKNYKKDMYGIPIPDQGEETEESEEEDGGNTQEDDEGEGNKEDEGDDNDDDDDDDDDDDTDDDSEHDELPPRRSYFLREHKPRTQIYEAPPIGPQLRRSCKAPALFQDSAPIQRKTRDHQMYRSPARRNSIRRKAAFHGSSSTSSDSSSSDDENRFQRRKAKSMVKARNRCLPMNLEGDDIAGLRKDRSRIGSSLADVDPMTVDRSITFESVGGLGKHVRALKEMVVFPLLYPEVFQKFKISPPRGVLFYGPPGTGKTLVARALANECSNDDRRVAFFMRKGADCLSKWVGESERQLRLLFDQAYQMRPSIIFFDEIDGLAPVRSSRQDQIHSSIVSTLLALMDGLDSRGEIVVIGATNRIDSIDPALRRPGRFDREFLFPLPSVQARQQILKINTTAWTPQLVDPFLEELAEKCVGYCGADLKALCTEAALLALRRRYPQIYTSAEKLQLDVSSINVSARDFSNAMQVIIPTAQRSVTSPARSLSKTVAPLLRVLLQDILSLLQTVFPCHLTEAAGVDTPAVESGERQDEFGSDDDEDDPCIFNLTSGKHSKKNNNTPLQQNYFNFGLSSSKSLVTHRPRLMLAGCPGQGQTSHLAPAVLHQLERLPVHMLDLPALFACSAKSPEESCAQVFREARRTSPSIVYLPHIDQWWPVLSDTLQATFLTLLKDLDPSSPILMFATTDTSYLCLDRTLQELFDNRYGEVVLMRNPTNCERKEFFFDLLLNQATKPPSRRKQAALCALEVLPKAAPPQERELTQAEKKKIEDQEEATNRELRLFLRDALNKIARDRKFNIFAKPVDIEEVPDYLEIVKTPMDLSTMMSKIDLRHYQSVKEFLADINLICTNALEYNPDKDPGDRAIRHRACALRDTAQSIVKNELDPEFEKLCEEMAESRKRRGVEPPKSVPAFYFTTPLCKPDDTNSVYPSRFSKRARGMEAEDISQVVANKKARKSDEHSVVEKEDVKPLLKSENTPAQSTTPNRRPVSTEKNSSTLKKSAKKTKCIWNYTSRRRRRIHQAMRLHRAQNRAKIQSQESPVSQTVVRENSPVSEEEEVTFSKSLTSQPSQEITESDISQDVLMDQSIEADIRMEPSTPTLNGTPNNTSTTSPPLSPHKQSDSKSPPSKRDLDFSEIKLLSTGPATVVDSGLGSSMESNCESMDSVDQLKQQTPQTVETPVETTPMEIPIDKEAPKEDKTPKDTSIHETPPSNFHMTRSRSGNKDTKHALDVLEEPEQPLVVDREKLESLLVDLIERTHDYTVDKLGKLYSMLSRCIFQHRKSYDKTDLLKDLESSIENCTDGNRRVTEVESSSMVVPSTSLILNHGTEK